MKRIISAGAIVFRREPGGEPKFLLLYHGRNYWNFPKGQLEEGERAMNAFVRELEEETGLKRADLKILSGFRATDRFFYYDRREASSRGRNRERRGIFKIVIFYLVETKRREVVVSEEHDGFGWFGYHEALRIAKYQNTRSILRKAHEFIRRGLAGGHKHSAGQGRHLR